MTFLEYYYICRHCHCHQNFQFYAKMFGAHRQQRLQILFENIMKDKPDIICLQEMFIFNIGFIGVVLSADFDFLHQRLSENGYHFFNDPLQTLPFFGCNSGLMIYSKYSMHSVNAQSFDIKHRRFISNKGYVSAVFDINDHDFGDDEQQQQQKKRTLNVVNTHLEHENKDYIKAQMKQIKDFLEEEEQKRKTDNIYDHCLLLGDFNSCPKFTKEENIECEAHRTFSVLTENLRELGLNTDLFKYYPRTFRRTEGEENASYDHMFVDENMAKNVQKLEEEVLLMSDHYGLMAYFDLKS